MPTVSALLEMSPCHMGVSLRKRVGIRSIGSKNSLTARRIGCKKTLATLLNLRVFVLLKTRGYYAYVSGSILASAIRGRPYDARHHRHHRERLSWLYDHGIPGCGARHCGPRPDDRAGVPG